jgi:hypothetical protein
VDAQGKPRILISAKDGTPTIVLLRADGETGASVALDVDGRPAVKLSNPVAGGPVAALEIDDKGAHVKFDRKGGASAYLFLNNLGGSGVVLIDPAGKRRLDAIVAPDGKTTIERVGDDGKALP